MFLPLGLAPALERDSGTLYQPQCSPCTAGELSPSATLPPCPKLPDWEGPRGSAQGASLGCPDSVQTPRRGVMISQAFPPTAGLFPDLGPRHHSGQRSLPCPAVLQVSMAARCPCRCGAQRKRQSVLGPRFWLQWTGGAVARAPSLSPITAPLGCGLAGPADKQISTVCPQCVTAVLSRPGCCLRWS